MSSLLYDTNPRNYQICALLGECLTNIGTVYVAKHLPSETTVAVKKYHLERVSREETKYIQDEIVLMRQLNHPNILSCFASFVSDYDIISVLPLMGYGSCSNVIARHFATGIVEPAIACILKSVLHALVYLHSKGIIHRAVRTSHILVSAEGNVTLCGLRYSCSMLNGGKRLKKIYSFPPSTLPNLNWLSPELLQQNLNGYNEKSDVYSIGVTACELANGVVPFWDTETTFMLTEKVRGASPQLIDCTTFINPAAGEQIEEMDVVNAVLSRRFSDIFHGFCELCMKLDLCERPTPSKLLTHAFFKQAPPQSSLPNLLLPAVPITNSNLTEVEDDLEAIRAAQNMMNNLNINSVNWDF